jgi:hypothetical protein
VARDSRGIIQQIFADTGDVADPTFDFAEGWPVAYSQAGGQTPEREVFNRLFQRLYALGRDVTRFGCGLPWEATVDYALPALVMGSDNTPYRSVQANGPSEAVGAVDPVLDVENVCWAPAASDLSDYLKAEDLHAATTTVAGIVELLTDNEATTGADTSRAATAANLKAVLNTRGLWDNAVYTEGPVDYDTLTSTRLYYVLPNAGNTNAPPLGPAAGYVVLALRASADVIVQIAIPEDGSTQAFYLRRAQTTWSAWETLITNYNGVVSQVGTRTANGTWTITGLVVGRPLYIGIDGNSDSSGTPWAAIKCLSGSDIGRAGYTSSYYRIGASTSYSSQYSDVFILIPTADTATCEVAELSYCTLRAYQ